MSAAELSKAQRMLDVLSAAPMGKATREKLSKLAAAGDAAGILGYVKGCIKNKSDVGDSIRNAGKASFESLYPRVKAIFEGKE